MIPNGQKTGISVQETPHGYLEEVGEGELNRELYEDGRSNSKVVGISIGIVGLNYEFRRIHNNHITNVNGKYPIAVGDRRREIRRIEVDNLLNCTVGAEESPVYKSGNR